jgi:hypothetical protein
MDTLDRGFFAIEAEIEKRRIQLDSVHGKDTSVRVEFRYPRGTIHYQYFTSIEDASKAQDTRCTYRGLRAVIEKPRSQRIQVRGPRGGWADARRRLEEK